MLYTSLNSYFQAVSNQTIRVTDTTALQVFIVVNIGLIVVAIVEYLVVLVLRRRDEQVCRVDPASQPDQLYYAWTPIPS